jgi:quercetin dioxygenase-like cupin family protein
MMEARMSGIIGGALDQSSWIASGIDGIDYAVLRAEEGGHHAIFVRMKAGTHGPAHTHPGGEELYIVAGEVSVGGRRLKQGAYLYTPPGATHDVDAHADSVLFVSLPQRAVFL